MPKWDARTRPEKDLARDQVFLGLGRVQTALFLPAEKCLCVKRAIEHGVIDDRTRLLAVERDPAVAQRMEKNLHAIGVRATVIRSWLHTTRLPISVDLAFLDFNGVIDLRTARWLANHLAARLNKNATVIFTLAHAWRNNRFMPRCHDLLLSQHRQLVGDIAEELDTDNLDIVCMIAVFRTIFSDWEFRVDYRLKYRDRCSVPMTVYRLYGFGKRKVASGSLEAIRSTLLQEKGENPHSACTVLDAPRLTTKMRTIGRKDSQMTGSSDAAYKAWETRRRNGWVHPNSRDADPVAAERKQTRGKAKLKPTISNKKKLAARKKTR